MQFPVLFRLRGDQSLIDHPAMLAEGIGTHVQHAPLHTLLLKRGTRMQGYVRLGGCVCCAGSGSLAAQGCVPGCHVELLRRLFAASAPVLRMEPVINALNGADLSRVVLGWPTQAAVPLDEALLEAWPQAHLLVHWAPGRKATLGAGALLLVGREGPPPAPLLQALGWRTLAVTLGSVGHTVVRRLGRVPPSYLGPLRPTVLQPTLLLPASAKQRAVPLCV